MVNKFACLAAGVALAIAVPASAGVKEGVEAWARGDYTRAVAEWRDLAAAGNPDAQFNMAQAYRLGRGVAVNQKQAEILYAKAAAQGHIKAADNYGLLLFQSNRRQEAMPYIAAAADRGDPRAQYLLGIAHFNGDMVAKDWVRAYALVTLANSAGLPQAPAAIQKMDGFIPIEQRQQAQLEAQKLKANSDARRSQQLATADLNAGKSIGASNPISRPITTPAPTRVAAASQPVQVTSAPTSAPTTTPKPAPTRVAVAPKPAQFFPKPVSKAAPTRTASVPEPKPASAAPTRAPLPSPSTRIPQPMRSTPVQPSVAAAQAAVAEAARVTGTESPATAGATFRQQPKASAAPVRTVRNATRSPKPAVKKPPRAKPTRIASATGPWRVQLGAFAVKGNADRLWTRVSGKAVLSGKKKIVIPTGRVVRLQAGGFTSRSSAQTACNTLKRGGQECLVTK